MYPQNKSISRQKSFLYYLFPDDDDGCGYVDGTHFTATIHGVLGRVGECFVWKVEGGNLEEKRHFLSACIFPHTILLFVPACFHRLLKLKERANLVYFLQETGVFQKLVSNFFA